MLLGRGEPEEELRPVRDQLGARDAGRQRDPLRQACLPVESPAREPLADAGHPEERLRLVEQPRGGVRDVRLRVAAEQHGDVVVLEDRPVGVAREPLRILEHAQRPSARSPTPGGRRGRARAPGRARSDGSTGRPQATTHAETGRCGRIVAVEACKHALELAARFTERRAAFADAKLGGDDLVMERRDEDLHLVVDDGPDAVEEVLLGRTPKDLRPRQRGR